MDLDELKEMHDQAYVAGQVTREKASDDLLFAWITQWDDTLVGVNLAYRGQFDMLRKAYRQITSDLAANPVQIDFEPTDADREDSADFAQGLYLTDEQDNATIQAYENALNECVVCGFGAWKMYTEYETTKAGLDRQVIKRLPIREANNTVFYDPNSYLQDRSDARFVSVLSAYSEEGYEELVEELTGEDEDDVSGDDAKMFNPVSFGEPEQSYVFPWVAGGTDKKVYVTEFYYKKKITDKIVTLTNPLGEDTSIYESQLLDMEDDLLDNGFEISGDREIERWEVTKYIASGSAILSEEVIPGECLPIIPVYGEFAYIEGEIHYEGITRLAKDPQRLRNFQMSYLADIVSRSPRPKPIFLPEQVRGFEFQYEDGGADNNFPYNLQNRTTANGVELPLGPVGMMPEQPAPTALLQLSEMTRQAIEDVANPGLPQDIADPDVSGKAVLALQARLDQQSMVYQTHNKQAKRYDARVYAQIASVVYDTPRQVTLTMPDGTRKKSQVMEQIIDKDTGKVLVINDISNMEWNVYADIGPAYSSMRDKTMEELKEMAANFAPFDPEMAQQIMLTQVSMMDGVGMDDIRKMARKKLIMSGAKEPETPEEEEMMAQQAQQAQAPDPMMLAAQAEMGKAQAEQMKAQTNAQIGMAKAQTDQQKVQVEMFKAETDRAEVQVKAEVAGADIDYKRSQAMGQKIDNILKGSLRQPIRQQA